MGTLELAAEKLEVLVKTEAERRTTVEELLKASIVEANIEEVMEELIEASRGVAKPEEKLMKLAEAKEAVRRAAQVLVYAIDDYCMAQAGFGREVLNWEDAQERYQAQYREGGKTQSSMVGQMWLPKNRVRTGRSFSARQGTCLPRRTPQIRSSTNLELVQIPRRTPQIRSSTNSELVQIPGHHQGPMSPPQVPPPQADSDFSKLNASAGIPSVLTRPLTDMGFPHADLPHRERVAMDATHQNDVGLNMSSFGAGPSSSMPPRSPGADMSISLNEDQSFRKPSTNPYLHRREGPKPSLYNAYGLDNYAEKFAMAVRDRLEAAEELVKVARKAAGAKQELRLISLAKAKENLIKESDEAANEEKCFRRKVRLIAEFMSEPYLMWHRHWQEKRSSQKHGTILLLQEERSMLEKRKRSRALEGTSLPKQGKWSRAQEERSLETIREKKRLSPSHSGGVYIQNYCKCLSALRGETE